MSALQYFGLILFCSLLVAKVNAQPLEEHALRISKNDPEFESKKYDLAPYLYVLTDSVGAWTIEDVSSAAFQQKFQADSFDLLGSWLSDKGSRIKTTWSKITIQSELDVPINWLINLSAGQVDFYLADSTGHFQHKRSGTYLPMKERYFKKAYGNVPCFPLTLLPGSTQTLYFKTIGNADFIGNWPLIYFNRTLFAPETYSDFDGRFRFSKALVLGILAAIAFYHFMIFLFHRNPVFLYFSLFAVTYSMVIAAFSGHASEYMAPDSDKSLGIVFVAIVWTLAYLFFYLFSRSYLRLKALLPVLDKIWAALVLARFVLITFTIAAILQAGGMPNLEKTYIPSDLFWLGINSILMFAVAMLAGFGSLIKGNRNAGVYLLAMAVFIYQTMAVGVNFYTSIKLPVLNIDDLVVALTFLLFSLGIARLVKSLEDEKIVAEKLQALSLAEANQVRAINEFKTRFYTNITHEFRTPLTIILGMTEQLGAKGKRLAAGAWQEGLGMIKRNGKKLLTLTNQMLALSKLEAAALPVSPVQGNVVAFLKYLVESFTSLAESKKIRLEFLADPVEMRMDFDPEKLENIVSNLLSNAFKFTPEGGHVQLAVSKTAEQFVLSVADTGAGISKEHIPRIFDRYFQVGVHADSPEGTGLGLALVQELVNLLEGEIAVESAPGKGSVFTVRLPLTNRAPLAPALPDTEKPISETVPLRTKKKHNSVDTNCEKLVLLIVEDSTDVVCYLQSLLADDYKIEVADNGRAGFEKAVAIIPDLVICDVMMPEMDGFAFCKKLKNDLRTSHIPVILLTAKTDAESKLEGLKAGADAYLAKPFDKHELFVRVKKLIELRRKLQDRYTTLLNVLEAPAQDTVFQKEDSFLREVRLLLTQHLDDEEYGIAELCRSLAMSRSQLYRKFKALTDTTVHYFIRNLRLAKAKELLRSTDLHITEIALATGFKNHSHFSRIFLETYGESPSQFRQEQPWDK